jgi:hypothetical protein
MKVLECDDASSLSIAAKPLTFHSPEIQAWKN